MLYGDLMGKIGERFKCLDKAMLNSDHIATFWESLLGRKLDDIDAKLLLELEELTKSKMMEAEPAFTASGHFGPSATLTAMSKTLEIMSSEGKHTKEHLIESYRVVTPLICEWLLVLNHSLRNSAMENMELRKRLNKSKFNQSK